MKFAHIADTHIRNLKFHREYREVFHQLYEKLIEEKVDYIIHCGDIAHTKTQISPEFVELCSDFFLNLSNIAPTYIILGNHDGNLKNSSRQDALTPIVNALDKEDLHLLKNSGEIVLDDKFTLNVLSVFDRNHWQKPSDPKRINIALYHGSISHCKTDLNWTMEKGEDALEIFEEYDYAMLGDIHRQQAMDEKGKVRYCGSTVQQNHGETNNKGFLIWDIEDKENFTTRHVELKNPKPFLTIELTPKGKIPRGTKIQEGARLRLVSNNNLPLEAIRRAAEIAKRRFKPESVAFLNRAAGIRGTIENLANQIFKEDLRDPVIQKGLIKEYLKDFQIDEEILERVYEINKKYNSLIEKDEEVGRNINWKLLSLEWENFFNYGEGNKIKFEDLSGVVGVLGKNFSGKSSIIDSFLFIMFNSTSKNSRKNLNVINQNRNAGRGKVEILVDGKIYSIERDVEKYVKKLKGEQTLEAKTNVNFEQINELGQIVSKNGLSRSDTDRNIRKVFGTLDDFLLTAMASQHGALSFISEGSTRRKEILAKFLDLEQFELKFKMAKEESSDLKGALKRFEGRSFDEEIKSATIELELNEGLTLEKKSECELLNTNIQNFKDENNIIDEKLKSVPSEIINISELRQSLEDKKSDFKKLQQENRKFKKECKEKSQLYDRINKFISEFDIESYLDKKKDVDEKRTKFAEIEELIERYQREKEIYEKKVNLLSEVPCGEEFSHCKFIRDAYVAKEQLPIVLKQVGKNQSSIADISIDLIALEPEIIEGHISKYEQILKRKNDIANEIAQYELTIEKNIAQTLALKGTIKELIQKSEVYEKNKEAIENYSELKEQRNNNGKTIRKLENELKNCENLLQQLYVSRGVHNERVDSFEKQKEELQNLRNNYEAYDLFMESMHPNGISYDIIKKRLPLINDEVAKVLANVVDFEIFFEEDGNKLNIFIKHPRYDARPLEMGSGAEKSIAAMAIRLALLSVSTLPKPNLFILDEPGTSLDEENMDGFVRILDLIKSYFDVVMLISHLDSLKDCVDTQIVIDKKDNLAYVNC